ncbi:MAG: chemotaxis protein CheW [Gammaproteobacteria bacterium]|nr:chemotaxis protein CheW [Gammaproteobacteria bacterium]
MRALEQNESLVIFRVGPVSCCASVRDVDSIVMMPSFTPMPKQAPCFAGVFRHRDQTVSVIKLRDKFGLPPLSETQHANARIILAYTRHGLMGYIVDEVLEVTSNFEYDWSDPPNFVSGNIFDKTLHWGEALVLSTDFDRLYAMNESEPLKQWIKTNCKEDSEVLTEELLTESVSEENATSDESTDYKDVLQTNASESTSVETSFLEMETTVNDIVVQSEAENTEALISQTGKGDNVVDLDTHREQSQFSAQSVFEKPSDDSYQASVAEFPSSDIAETSAETSNDVVNDSVSSDESSLQESIQLTSEYETRQSNIANDQAIVDNNEASVPQAYVVSPDYDTEITPDTVTKRGNVMRWLLLVVVLIVALVTGYFYFHFTGESINESISSDNDTKTSGTQTDKIKEFSSAIGADIGQVQIPEDSPVVDEPKLSTNVVTHQDEIRVESKKTDIDESSSAVNSIDGVARLQTKQEANIDDTMADSVDEANSSESAKATTQNQSAPTKRNITGEWQVHTVVTGDTLWDLSKTYLHTPWRYPELAKWSNIRNPDLIYPGDIVHYQTPE